MLDLVGVSLMEAIEDQRSGIIRLMAEVCLGLAGGGGGYAGSSMRCSYTKSLSSRGRFMNGKGGFFSSCIVLYFLKIQGMRCGRTTAIRKVRLKKPIMGSAACSSDVHDADFSCIRMCSTQIVLRSTRGMLTMLATAKW